MKLILEKNIYLKFLALVMIAGIAGIAWIAWLISNDMDHYFYARATALAVLAYVALLIRDNMVESQYLFICTGLFIALTATFISINMKGKMPYLIDTINAEVFNQK